MQPRNRTTIALVLLITVAALVVAGCRVSRPSGELRVGVLALPNDADPAVAASPELLGLVYETLVARGPDGNYYPGLAKDWSVSADGRVVTLNLKAGVSFSNGSALTAEAVKTSLRRLQEKDAAALGPVDRIDVAGEAIVLSMARAYPPIWGAPASPRAAIVASAPAGAPVGTGPFLISELTAEVLLLSRNPSYQWAPDYYRVRGPARVETVLVKRYPEPAALAAAVTAGQLDLAGGTSLVPSAGWTTVTAPGDTLLYMGFDVSHAPYDDARVRRAIALIAAGGRSAAAKASPGWVATGAFLPGAAWGAAETQPSGDPVALLGEAGYARGTDGLYRTGDNVLRLSLTATLRAEDQAAAAAIVGALRGAGIDAGVSITPDGAHAYLARFTWSEPDILYYLLHTGAEANRSGYSDGRADRLLEAGAGAINLSDRQAIYQALQVRLADDCPWVPILSTREEWIVRDTTTNVRVGPGSRLFLTTATVK